jgi:hypothetical protein
MDRRLHVDDVRCVLERLGHVGHRGLPVGAGPVLHDDHLAGRLHREAGRLDDFVGLTRIPVSLVRPLGLDRPQLSTEYGHADHEGDPPEDRERPVAGAPKRGAGRNSLDLFPRLHGNDAMKKPDPDRSR